MPTIPINFDSLNRPAVIKPRRTGAWVYDNRKLKWFYTAQPELYLTRRHYFFHQHPPQIDDS